MVSFGTKGKAPLAIKYRKIINAKLLNKLTWHEVEG